MNIKRSKKLLPCELCNVPKLKSYDHTICNECDAKLEAEQTALAEKRAKRVAHRRCRLCTGTLEASRYFACMQCIPPESMAEDDGMESMDTFTDERLQPRAHTVKPVPAGLLDGTKACKDCKRTLPKTDFTIVTGENRLRACCRECMRARNRAHQQRERARNAKAKEMLQ